MGFAHSGLCEKEFSGPEPLKEEMLILSEAQRLRLTLEELGPTFIKFGQIVSTRHDLVPEAYIKELEKLQDRVPPFEFLEAKKVIEREFGKKLEDIFRTFESGTDRFSFNRTGLSSYIISKVKKWQSRS